MLQHLKSRKLNIERYFNISYDCDSVTFPLYSVTKNLIGYQRYTPNAEKKKRNEGKYYTHFSSGNYGFWGTETLEYKGPIFLCEGIFKSCSLHNFDLCSLAVLGNDPKQIVSQLKLLGREIITVPDPDKAGNKLKKFGHLNIDLDIPLDEMYDIDIMKKFSRWISVP